MYKYTNVFWLKDKSPLLSVQNKHFYLLFSINKLNYSKAKKNEKSRDTVQQIYIHIHIHIHIYTKIHTYIHIYKRHIHINITNARIHTYISIHRRTRTHDYAHVHAIVKMQLKIVVTHARKCTCKDSHAHRNACPWAHICAHTYAYALPLSPICMFSLVMLQLRICLQVTINPFPPGHWSTLKPDK